MYLDVSKPTWSINLIFSLSSPLSSHHNIYIHDYVMPNKTNLLYFILYIRLFILLITLVALLHLWGEGYIYAGNRGKEKQTQAKFVDTSLQTPAYMFSCNCRVPL